MDKRRRVWGVEVLTENLDVSKVECPVLRDPSDFYIRPCNILVETTYRPLNEAQLYF